MNLALVCFARRSGLAAAAIGLILGTILWSVPSVARGDVPPSVCAGSITHGHVFFCTPQGPVDVTSTLYMSNGQIYAVYNGAAIAIFINSSTGTVTNTNGTLIGYVDQSTTQAPTTQPVA